MKALGLQPTALASIDCGDRLRSVDEAYAQLLAENIAQVGRLRQPIEIRKVKGRKGESFTLIAGGHRLRAAQILGWESIDAFVYEGGDDEARLAEIDENLVRHDLNPLDRAVFLAQRKEIYERLNPDAKRGGDRRSEKSKGHDGLLIGFARDTAQRSGLSDRTIKRAVFIASKLAPDVRAALPGTDLSRRQSELLALAKLGHAEQRLALTLLLGDSPKARSMAAAIRLIKGVRESDQTGDAGYLALLAKWGRATARERQAFLMHLRETGQLDELLASEKEAA